MSPDVLPEFIRQLLDPLAYPHPAGEVGLVQTHISYVLLAGDYVYKFKKPVDFGFLNFTTMAKRRYFCEQELLLNRRLCPTIYLDLVTMNGNGVPVLNGPGPVIEYGIKMKRMPADRMMDKIIRAGLLTADMLEAVVDTLVPFYIKADSTERHFGTAQAVGINVLENFAQIQEFVGGEAIRAEQFELLSNFSHRFLEHEEIFEQRIAAGRIHDCHGDLHSGNICLADQVYIYDCIEFNQRFRYCDVASDVAFLAMDLDYHGCSQLSTYFIDYFQRAAYDDSLLEVLNFYKCYRAAVRGKINLFTAAAPEVDAVTRDRCLEKAGRYFRLAENYAKIA